MISQQNAPAPTTIRAKQQVKPMYGLFVGACVFELCYLLLVISSMLLDIPLSETPLVAIWPQILSASQFPLSTLETAIIHHVWLSPVILGLIILGLISTYIFIITRAVRIPQQEMLPRSTLYLLLGGALLFGLTLLVQPRIFSDDAFNSIFSGRILAIYHADPLNTTPKQFAVLKDPYLTWVISGYSTRNIYGPLWLCIASLLVSISSNPMVSLFLFKGFTLLTHLINCVLIWLILGKLAPQRRLLGTLLYAWSPLALIELASSGHNDGLLICLFLVATWLYILQVQQTHQRREQAQHATSKTGRLAFLRTPWFLHLCVLFVFSLAIGINLITLLIAPLYVWFDLRAEKNGLRLFLNFGWQVLFMLAPAILIMLPFWRGAQTFFDITSAVDLSQFGYAPISILVAPLRSLFLHAAGKKIPGFLQPATAADMTVRASAIFIFILIYANLCGKIRHKGQTSTPTDNLSANNQHISTPGLDTLLSSCAIAVFCYMILVSGWFWPWYILWILWLVALRRFDTFTSMIMLLSGTALLIYTFVGFTRAPLATYQSALIFGIPLVYLLVVKYRQKQAERTLKADVR